MAESVGGGKWEKYTDNEPIDLERSATEITVEKRVDESGRMEVRAIFPPGPTPLYFGPPFTFDSSGLSWSFKMDKNVCWMCGLVPIGKKDYRGPLSHDKLICLEEEKEASLMTPSYKTRRERDRNACNEKEMDLHQKEIEVQVLGKQKEVILTAKKGKQVETAIFDVSDSKWADGFSFCVGGAGTGVLTTEQVVVALSIKPAKRS